VVFAKGSFSYDPFTIIVANVGSTSNDDVFP
jgi:hypothetical protein